MAKGKDKFASGKRIKPDLKRFRELAKREPGLLGLLQKARSIKDDKTDPSFCANRIWYGFWGLKAQLCKLVGWEASNPELRTTDAYNVAYETVSDALPYCRNCSCYWPFDTYEQRKM